MENNENKFDVTETCEAGAGEPDSREEATVNEPQTLAGGGDGVASEPEYQPKGRYERLLYRVYRDETLAEILKITSYAIVLLTVYAFLVRLAGLIETPIELVKLLAVTGIPFAAVSLVRVLINAPRPYELLEFYEKKPKGKSGRSFPSRHVFSVFIIATVLITHDPVLSVGLMLAGALLAFLRVALGIHFVRDVVAGALIGAVSGGIGLAVIHLL